MTTPAPRHPRDSDTLEMVRDFLNTLDLRTFQGAKRGAHGTEELADARGLVRWFAARRLLARGDGASDADVRLAHALRAELRAAIVARDTPRAAHVPSVTLGQFHLQVRLKSSGEPDLVAAEGGTGVRAAMAFIVSRVAVGAMREEWGRLRVCAAPDCCWVFYDRSKAGRGRWCSMRVCGNRFKTRAYRASRGT